MKVKAFSHVQLSVILWTVLHIEAKLELSHVCNNNFLCTALEFKHILHSFNSPEEQEFLHITIEKLD